MSTARLCAQIRIEEKERDERERDESSTRDPKDNEKEKDEAITRQPALRTQIDHELTLVFEGEQTRQRDGRRFRRC